MTAWVLSGTVSPMLDLLWCNPWRPADAWWQRAIGIIGHGHAGTSSRLDTLPGRSWIRRAEEYLHACCTAKSRRERRELSIRYPAMYQAHQVYSQARPQYRHLRSAIEARLLARQTSAEIAALHGCHTDTVDAYEALYFNVRDRLDYSDFVQNCLLNPLVLGRTTALDRGTFWKLFGYAGGPLMLDAVMAELPKASRVKRRKNAQKNMDATAVWLVKLKAALAALSLAVGSDTEVFLIRTLVKYIKLERTTAARDQATSSIEDNLAAMLAVFPYATVEGESGQALATAGIGG